MSYGTSSMGADRYRHSGSEVYSATRRTPPGPSPTLEGHRGEPTMVWRWLVSRFSSDAGGAAGIRTLGPSDSLRTHSGTFVLIRS